MDHRGYEMALKEADARLAAARERIAVLEAELAELEIQCAAKDSVIATYESDTFGLARSPKDGGDYASLREAELTKERDAARADLKEAADFLQRTQPFNRAEGRKTIAAEIDIFLARVGKQP